jgi:hypothetical protein
MKMMTKTMTTMTAFSSMMACARCKMSILVLSALCTTSLSTACACLLTKQASILFQVMIAIAMGCRDQCHRLDRRARDEEAGLMQLTKQPSHRNTIQYRDIPRHAAAYTDNTS